MSVKHKKKFISQSMALSLEAYFKAHIHSFLEKSGVDVMAISIGGKFNREGILLELGFLPVGSDSADCKAFIVDRHIDDHDAEPLEQPTENKLERIARVTGLSLTAVTKVVADLPKRFTVGDKYSGKKGTYSLVGFSKKKEAFVVFSKKASKVILVPKAAFKKLEKI